MFFGSRQFPDQEHSRQCGVLPPSGAKPWEENREWLNLLGRLDRRHPVHSVFLRPSLSAVCRERILPWPSQRRLKLCRLKLRPLSCNGRRLSPARSWPRLFRWSSSHLVQRLASQSFLHRPLGETPHQPPPFSRDCFCC